MRFLRSLLLLVVLLSLGMASAWAQQGRGRPPARVDRQAPERDPRDSLSDSVRRVQRDNGGQVLGAERVPFDGREMHRVKVLDDRGRVRVYMDDPRRERGSRGGSDRGRDRGRRPTRDDDD